jgi:integrase
MPRPMRQTAGVTHGVYSRHFRHGTTWYIRFSVAGREVKERLGREADGFTRTLAKQALQTRLADIARGIFKLPQARKPLPFRDLAARYREYAAATKRSWPKERYTLTQLEHEFGSTPIAELTAWRIERWKAKRRSQVAPATVNRDLTLLKALFTKAVLWKVVDRSPLADVRYLPVNNARLRYLTTEEIPRLLRGAVGDVAPWLAPGILLALHTGLRQGELLTLRWRDVDLGVGLLSVEVSKNNEKRRIPLNAPVRAVLQALPHYGEWVLARPWGERISRTTLYAAFGRACARAGIEDFHWHDLRHTFASQLVMTGVDLRTVQELVGHKTLDMTMRYSHLAPAHKAAAVEKLAAALERFADGTEDAKAAPRMAFEAGSRVKPSANLERSWNVFSGRQTPAKREYLQSQQLGEWRRGESNPRPKVHPRARLRV